MKRTRLAVASAAAATVTALALTSMPADAVPAPATQAPQGAIAAGTAAAAPAARPGSAKLRALPPKRSNKPWRSGAWTGGTLSAARTAAFGTWRGTPTDVAMTYPERGTWRAMQTSTWHIDTYKNFRGTLMYGLPLLPQDGSATLKDVAAGRHDATFNKIARDLKSRGRGNAIIRVGWEANGDWYPWHGTAANAADFRAAYRRVVTVMRKVSPQFVMAFDVSAGYSIKGQTNRLDALTKLYPGNDVVDLIGVDVYDWHTTGARNMAEWRRAVRPRSGPGIADVAAFARARGKGFVVPEWGVANHSSGGHGDNPYFVRMMYTFFQQNRDILVAELYFNEPDPYISSGIWESDANPRSAAAYRQLW